MKKSCASCKHRQEFTCLLTSGQVEMDMCCEAFEETVIPTQEKVKAPSKTTKADDKRKLYISCAMIVVIILILTVVQQYIIELAGTRYGSHYYINNKQRALLVLMNMAFTYLPWHAIRTKILRYITFIALHLYLSGSLIYLISQSSYVGFVVWMIAAIYFVIMIMLAVKLFASRKFLDYYF